MAASGTSRPRQIGKYRALFIAMIKSLKDLEIMLQGLHGFSKPKLHLEQYTTPPHLAASIVWLSFMRGELGRVVDVGCGPGVFAVAAASLGSKVVCMDVDEDAVKDCLSNSAQLSIDAVVMDALRPGIRDNYAATCFINPPFGIWSRHGLDTDMVKAALGFCNVIYSIHKRSIATTVLRKIGGQAVGHSTLVLPHTYPHHDKHRHDVEVIIVRTEKRS